MNRIFRNCRAAALAAIVGIILIPDASIALAQSTALPLSCVPASLSVAQRSDGNLSVTCTLATTTSSVCSITVAGTPLSSLGGNVTVTANNCGTGLTWANVVNFSGTVAPSTSSGVSFFDTIGPNKSTTTPVTYAAYAVTGSGGSATAPVQVTVAAASSGGGGGTTSCGVTPKVISWPTSTYVPVGTVSGSTPLIVQFTIPAGTAPNSAGRLVQFGSGDQKAQFTSALSTSPCSFGPDASIGSVPIPGQYQNSAYAYNIGGPSLYGGGFAVLTPGVPYYLNIENTGGSGSHAITVSITGY